MRADRGKTSSGLLTTALLAAVVSLTGVAGAVKLAHTMVNLGPGVGDIISFDAKSATPGDMESQTVLAHDASGECMLDLGALRKTGGSLIIETRVAGNPASYRVHWAGKQSSADQHNCGSSAELTLDASKLGMLAMAAGGWGPIHQPLIPLSFPGSDGRK